MTEDTELIARVLAVEAGHIEQQDTEPLGIEVFECITNRFADELSLTNERFDRDRFLKAAGVT